MENELNPTHLPEFSFYRAPITNKLPCLKINIQELHKRITTDLQLKDNTLEVRKYKTKDERREVKASRLPFVTPSGAFRARSLETLTQHSGYLCLDLDDISASKHSVVKNTLLNDTQIKTLLLFKSPSNEGYKWFIKIPQDHLLHGKYFDAVENYLMTKYGYKVDKACRDVARACFMSYDDEAYLNPDLYFEPLDESFLKEWLPKLKNKNQNQNHETPQHQKLAEVNYLVEAIQNQKIDITSDYKDWCNVGFALCELGEDGRSVFHQISSICSKYDEDKADVKYTKLMDAYDGRTTLGTLFHMAKRFGVKLQSLEPSTIEVKQSTPRTAAQRMMEAKNQEPIKSLLGGIWYTGELHILFGDNNTGKSIWATQIADCISKGKNVFNILPNETPASKVLFYDFELSDKQFEKRYMNGTGQPYDFSDHLHIDNINFQELYEANPNMNTDDLIINKIETDILQLKPNVVIIDNMTYLKTETTQEAKVALELIRKLNQLKRKYDISILVISHTPKIKGGMPITNNDLAGSKNLSNLVDSISAIGKSTRGKDEKYIKLIKCRSGEKVFDTDNVISVRITKDDCFLGFEYLDCENEFEHLKDQQKERARIEQEELKAEAIRLHSEDKSYREIARLLGVGKTTIERWINGK